MPKKSLGLKLGAAVLLVALAVSFASQSALGKYVGTFFGKVSSSIFDNVQIYNDTMIALTAADYRTVYVRNEAVDTPTVTVHYKDGTTRVLTQGDFEITAVDTSTPGVKTRVITYRENGNSISTTITVRVNAVSSIHVVPLKTTYEMGKPLTKADFKVTAVTNTGESTTVENYTLGSVDMSTEGKKTVNITYVDDGVTFYGSCTITVKNLTLLTGNNAHDVYWFNEGLFNVSYSSWPLYTSVYQEGHTQQNPYLGGNGEKIYGLNPNGEWKDPAIESNGGATLLGVKVFMAEGRYDLIVEDALPYTTLGINCIVGYSGDENSEFLGFGYYYDGDVTTLQWNAPAVVYTEQNPGYLDGTNTLEVSWWGYMGPYNGHAVTTTKLYDFAPGTSHVVHWVAVFEDGIQPLSEWTVHMKEASSQDAAFVDTAKPNVNVIVLAGQSNMFGASPLIPAVAEAYSAVDYSNVFIRYANINFMEDHVSLKTYFSNDAFDQYQVGIGGQGNAYFGPELALAYYLATTPEFAAEQWYIVKYAAAGTGLLAQWTNNCSVDGVQMNLTDGLIQFVKDAIAPLEENNDVCIRSFLWMQGESDAISPSTAAAYQVAEKTMVETVRTALGAYAVRAASAPDVVGSGISFLNAGIAINDTDVGVAGGGPNDWIYAETVNAGKVANSQWLCAPMCGVDNKPVNGPLAGYTFQDGNGNYLPSISNPDQSEVIPNSIFLDTFYLVSKLNATGEHPYYAEGDRTDWAHYSAESMLSLGGLFGAGFHFLRNQNL